MDFSDNDCNKNGAPIYAIVFMIPMMLLGGGLEEAGWRYILQPELEKKYNLLYLLCR